MVEHLVLFQLKPAATEAQIDTMLAGLRGLADQIDVIRELSCGRNYSDRANGHQVALRVLFASREDLAAYIPHPAHQACVEQCVKPIMAGVTVADYEC